MRGFKALLLATVFLIADMSALTSAMPTDEPEIRVEIIDEMGRQDAIQEEIGMQLRNTVGGLHTVLTPISTA